MAHPPMFSLVILAACWCLAATPATAVQLTPGESVQETIGTTSITVSHAELADGSGDEPPLPLASMAFDKDIRAQGNDLPAGAYDVRLHQVAADDVQIAFVRRAASDLSVRDSTAAKEWLRVAVRPADAERVAHPLVELVDVTSRGNVEGRRRGRQRRGLPAAELTFHWASHTATIRLELTGVVWRDSPPPELPDRIRGAWAVVMSSLDGLSQADLDKHVQHFAQNFESDWDDGGSQEAHEQYIGRKLFEGEFEDMVLKLDQLEWTASGTSVRFRNIMVHAPLGVAPLDYRLEQTNEGWEIVHIDGPKE